MIKVCPFTDEVRSECLEKNIKGARVIPFDDLAILPDETDIWCETANDNRVFAMTTRPDWFTGDYIFREGAFLGEIRFWTARPTEEERKAVKWIVPCKERLVVKDGNTQD